MAPSEAAKEKEEAGKRKRPREGGNSGDMPGSRHGGDYTQGAGKEKIESTRLAAFGVHQAQTLAG